MKRNLFLILIGVVLLACAKEPEVAVTSVRTLEVNVGEATRIQLDGSINTVWNAGDSVSVFYKGGTHNDLWLYNGSDKSSSGTISCSDYGVVFASGTTYAVYPYSSSYVLDSLRVNVTMPATQRFVDGGYDYTVMAAKTDSNTLKFKYAVSMVCLDLEGGAVIDSIILRGNASEPLCGPAVLDMRCTPVVKLDAATAGRKILIGGTQVVDSAKTFVVVPSGNYSQGFTAEVFYSNGTISEIRHTMPVCLEPGQYLLLDDYVNEYQIVSLMFESDPQTSESLLYSFPTKTKMEGKTIDIVKSYTFNTPYTFKLWAKNGFCKSTSGGGARINYLQFSPDTTGNAWIRIPVMSGWKLSQINIECYKSTSTQFSVSSSVDSEGAGSGDLYPVNAMNFYSTTIKLTASTDNLCYLCFNGMALISSLDFVYRK